MEVTVGNEETSVVLRRVNPEVVRGVVVVKNQKEWGANCFPTKDGKLILDDVFVVTLYDEDFDDFDEVVEV